MVQPDALSNTAATELETTGLEINNIEIKGSLFPLSILQLEATDLSILALQLEQKRLQAKDFFYRAPLVINIEKTLGELFDFSQLKSIVEQQHFVCVGICNASAEQATAAMQSGLAILKQPRSTSAKTTAKTTSEKARTEQAQPAAITMPAAALKTPKIIQQNVRSGQQVYAKDSDLIIIGSVGNGAEVIADGSIHIYGNLRGRALAGASGADSAVIYCQSMEAELISIAGNYWVSDQIPENTWRQSALFNFQSNTLSAQPIG